MRSALSSSAIRTSVFLVPTIYEDDERIFEARCAGASGYLLKKTPPERLLECLREAADGGGPLSPEIAQRVIALFRKFRPPAKAACELTPHEVRILGMLADGHDYASAAVELKASVSTVVYHMRQIFRKLQVHSESEAVAEALRAAASGSRAVRQKSRSVGRAVRGTPGAHMKGGTPLRPPSVLHRRRRPSRSCFRVCPESCGKVLA